MDPSSWAACHLELRLEYVVTKCRINVCGKAMVCATHAIATVQSAGTSASPLAMLGMHQARLVTFRLFQVGSGAV